jgi:osmotically inducible lipoprotein OsmB
MPSRAARHECRVHHNAQEYLMNKSSIVSIFARSAAVAGAAACIALTGCAGMTEQQKSTAAGAAIGGVAGNVLGGGTIGTLGGAAVGGVIGNQVGK